MKKHYRDGVRRRRMRRVTFQVKNSLALPERATRVGSSLERLQAAFARLFSDENFITLLEAESLNTIPSCLNPVLEEARDGHEIC
jgi:hypothetical protein